VTAEVGIRLQRVNLFYRRDSPTAAHWNIHCRIISSQLDPLLNLVSVALDELSSNDGVLEYLVLRYCVFK